ncbi:MAG: catechol 2,3-dioxygenase-like lactoylglutathione lyase family enzyme [Candidatus Poriferisodalaceae bacterium]|jgi:uncharacterized protein
MEWSVEQLELALGPTTLHRHTRRSGHDRAKAFCLDGLGWHEVDQPSGDVCFIQMQNMVLGLYGPAALAEDVALEVQEPPKFRGISLAYKTSSDHETDEVLAEAVAAGTALLKAAEKVFWGGYSGYFADPDGHA